MRIKALAAGLILSWASASFAQAAAAPKPEWKFELHGFVGASISYADAVFNEHGQKAWFVVAEPATDKTYIDGDIRQTRLSFAVTGPAKILGGATPKGVAEVDFFAVTSNSGTNNPGQGAFGDVNQLLRLRLAYVELNWGNTILRVGQEHDLILGAQIPASVGHIANPLSYAAGQIGFRRPGVTLLHSIPMGAMKLELGVQVKQPEGVQGSDTLLANGAGGLNIAAGSSLPSVEARLRLISKAFTGFVAGHWHQYDRNGVGDATATTLPAGTGDSMETMAVQGGLKVEAAGLTLMGNGYYGKNVGVLIGFGGATLNNPSTSARDLTEWGGWGQLGYNLTKEFSAWVFAGVTHPDYDDVKAIFRTGTAPSGKPLRNVTISGMLRYSLQGVTFAAEYAHFQTSYDSAAGARSDTREGNQLMLSGMYFF